MRAFAKAAPYLRSQSYFTGDDAEDETVKTWTEKFLKVFNHFLINNHAVGIFHLNFSLVGILAQDSS